MLFNSLTFILLFLPVSVLVYFLLNHRRLTVAGRVWLVLASLFFYGYWNPAYLALILASIAFNFGIGEALQRPARSRGILVAGIAVNLALLGYYKYANFFIDNLNWLNGRYHWLEGRHLKSLQVILPLGISFFTFTQIAYLVDAWRGQVRERNFINYCLFVTFFPHLIAGPIIHHKEMMPQFAQLRNKMLNWRNMAMGLFLFGIGLFKKVVIADTLAQWATLGFDGTQTLGFWDAWGTSLGYTLQLYYDFSGYCDMAIGAALMVNIRLPDNFNSPYKALDIQDFWRRWHMTLSRWLRDYLYIPLGGNRHGEARTYLNLVLTFLLGGLWHGAGWTFIIWGALHGAAVAMHRFWQKAGLRLPVWLAWTLTFLFVNVAWVFFRANTVDSALRVLHGMADIRHMGVSRDFSTMFAYLTGWTDPGYALPVASNGFVLSVTVLLGLATCLPIALFAPNAIDLLQRYGKPPRPAFGMAFKTAVLLAIPLLYLLLLPSRISQFIYFNF